MSAVVSSSTWPAMFADALDDLAVGRVEAVNITGLGRFGKSEALALLMPMIDERGLDVLFSVREDALIVIRA